MTETSFGAVETEDGATNKLLTVNLNFVAMSGWAKGLKITVSPTLTTGPDPNVEGGNVT